MFVRFSFHFSFLLLFVTGTKCSGWIWATSVILTARWVIVYFDSIAALLCRIFNYICLFWNEQVFASRLYIWEWIGSYYYICYDRFDFINFIQRIKEFLCRIFNIAIYILGKILDLIKKGCCESEVKELAIKISSVLDSSFKSIVLNNITGDYVCKFLFTLRGWNEYLKF